MAGSDSRRRSLTPDFSNDHCLVCQNVHHIQPCAALQTCVKHGIDDLLIIVVIAAIERELTVQQRSQPIHPLIFVGGLSRLIDTIRK